MRGGAAERRRAGAGFEIVARGGAAERHVQMGVDVDAAGQQQHARRVDHSCPRRSAGNVRRDLVDRLAFDQDVGGEGLVGGDDRAVANEQCSSAAPAATPHAVPAFCSGRPVSTRSMVMQSSTGQTSQHRLQPTHSCSSTRGMRASGVVARRVPLARRPASESACIAIRAAGARCRPARCRSRWMHWCAPSQQACSRARSRCTCLRWMRATIL